jgi:hypothetical protein
MAKAQIFDEGSGEKLINALKKRRKVFFEVSPETGLDEFASETVKMFDGEGAMIGKLTYMVSDSTYQITHFHIDIWEDDQAFPERFIKWFEGYAKKKKAQEVKVEIFDRDARTYDLISKFRDADYSPTATGFAKGRTSFELHKKL